MTRKDEQHRPNHAGRNQTTFNDIRGGGIKSVQRGYYEFDWTGNSSTINVPISTVDPAKTIVSLRVETVSLDARREVKMGKISINANAISIELGSPGMSSYHIPTFVEWQLIEGK